VVSREKQREYNLEKATQENAKPQHSTVWCTSEIICVYSENLKGAQVWGAALFGIQLVGMTMKAMMDRENK
jgi:hypothetical protein